MISNTLKIHIHYFWFCFQTNCYIFNQFFDNRWFILLNSTKRWSYLLLLVIWIHCYSTGRWQLVTDQYFIVGLIVSMDWLHGNPIVQGICPVHIASQVIIGNSAGYGVRKTAVNHIYVSEFSMVHPYIESFHL